MILGIECKQIHVNSYVKRDETQVKEHFRNIDTNNYGNELGNFVSGNLNQINKVTDFNLTNFLTL